MQVGTDSSAPSGPARAACVWMEQSLRRHASERAVSTACRRSGRAPGGTRLALAKRMLARYPVRLGATLSVVLLALAQPAGAQASFAEDEKLLPGDPTGSDFFGWAVSVSGQTAVVGAFGEGDSFGDQLGAAYVFEKVPGAWSQAKKLVADIRSGADRFGYSVAIDGDFIVVGADQADGGGAAYVYSRNEGGPDNWGFVKKLVAADRVSNDYFGRSVAIEGDEIVVGADADDASTGAAYLFERNQGGANQWGEVTKLTASDAAAGDRLGESVSIEGDWIVAGAPGDETDRGAAYVFARDEGGAGAWGELRKLTAPDGAAFDELGHAVVVGDGAAVIGAHRDDSFRGSAHVYLRDEGGTDNWGWFKKLTASDGAGGHSFGHAVASDGVTTAIGAWGADAQVGAVYVFERNAGGPGTWAEVQKLTASDGALMDYFGYAVSLARPFIVAGASRDDDNGPESGAAYVFQITAAEIPALDAWALTLACAALAAAALWRLAGRSRPLETRRG